MNFLNKLARTEKELAPPVSAEQARIHKIYEEHNAALRRFASRYLRTEGEISDIIQDVFARLSGMDSIQHLEADPLPYLITMTRNMIRDGYRKVAVRDRYEEAVKRDQKSGEALGGFSDLQTPERIIEGRQQLVIIVSCVKKMPPDIQQAFLLSRVKNMTYKEVAQKMGVSERTVLRHVAQAVSVIKSRLEQG
ncbi:RNA polymerase sigma factor [Kordiimonas sp.]|uniref:RNA polymerase sigma factor n=1 Tax=Kordiimonas sp. TaxID=1970157 RepID=UPI003A958696